MRTLVAIVSLFLLLSVQAGPARALEVFRSYRSDIDVARSGTLTVTETIRATVEGNRIRRGIYRDLPLTFTDANGKTARAEFKLVSVKRDGAAEPYRTESIPGGIRIYTGDADVLLSQGEHIFAITYETARQIRFFADHDELYWNVTGTEWAFPIDEASAVVTLPEGVRPQALDVFTGAYGSTSKNARVFEDGGRITFTTTRSLAAGEGLTLAINMPKGSIDPPTASQENAWWVKDNLHWIIAIVGLVITTLYYARMWLRFGRDPARGVMVPRWDAPDGISPALVNYIDNKGFSGHGWTALSAAALNLAVDGYVVLEDLQSSLVISRTQKPKPASFPAGEAAILAAVERNGGTLSIDKSNGPQVQRLGSEFRNAMEKEHRGKYYKANTLYMVGGVFLSAVFLVAILLFGQLGDNVVLIILPVVAAVLVAIFSVVFGRLFQRPKTLAARIAAVLLVGIFGFLLVSGLLTVLAVSLFQAVETHEMPLLIGIGGIVLVNLLFLYLMGAPTPLGSKMMDGIDGLRQYLTLAEQQRMNMAGAPVMSPQHFERLLPYAVALSVEKPWSETFDRWLLAAAAGAAAYQPAWYHGQSFGSGSFGDRMGGFAGSMASTMTASLPPPPKSSSSGFSSGGGFSGGGGGGGGGGGW